jgi:hypothetical protein
MPHKLGSWWLFLLLHCVEDSYSTTGLLQQCGIANASVVGVAPQRGSNATPRRPLSLAAFAIDNWSSVFLLVYDNRVQCTSKETMYNVSWPFRQLHSP